MKPKNMKVSLDTGAKLEGMSYTFLQGEKGHELEFTIMSCGTTVELDATDTAEVYLTFPDTSVYKTQATVDDTNNVVKFTMDDNMTAVSGSVKLQVQILNDNGVVTLYTQPATYLVEDNLAYTGGKPVSNVPTLFNLSDKINDNAKDIAERVATDGSNEMDAGYTPTSNLQVATKEYVDTHSGGGTGGGGIQTDGSVEMDSGYVPTSDQAVATKKYVDDEIAKVPTGGGGTGLTPADQEKLDHISISQDIDLDITKNDVDAVKGRTNGISYDATELVTKVAHNVVLENDQADFTDVATQGSELASTKRVDDMIKAIPSGSSVAVGDNTGDAYDGGKGKYLEDTLGFPMDIPDVITIDVDAVKQTDTSGNDTYIAGGGIGSVVQDSNVVPLDKIKYYEISGTGVMVQFFRPEKISLSKVEFLNGTTVVDTITSSEFDLAVQYDIAEGAYRENLLVKGKTLADLTTNSGLKLEVKSYDMTLHSVKEVLMDTEDSLANAVQTLGIPESIPTTIEINATGVAQPADADGIVKYIASGSSNLVQSSDAIGLSRVEYYEDTSGNVVHLNMWRPVKIEVLGTVKVGNTGSEVEIDTPTSFSSNVVYDPSRGAYKESMTISTTLSAIASDPTKLRIVTTRMKIAPILPSILDAEKGMASIFSKRLMSLYGMGTQAQADALTDDDGREGDLFFVLDDATS